MFRWNSRATTVFFLIALLSTDAVFGGIIQVERAHLPKSDSKPLGKSTKPFAVSQLHSRDLKVQELSSLSALAAVHSSDLELKRKDTAPESSRNIQDNSVTEDLIRAGKEKLKQEETAHEAMGAIAYVAGTAATFLTRPLINAMPPNFNKAIIGIATFINGMGNNGTQEHPYNSTALYNDTLSFRKSKAFPSYNLDGVISTAAAWMNDENTDKMDKMDSVAPSYEESVPYASLRGPEAARLGMVDPIITVIGGIRRAIATEFLTTALVMTIAHLTRLFFVNLPTIVPILGLSRRADGHPELASSDTLQDPTAGNSNVKAGQDPVKRAELIAREVIAAVTRDQCVERAVCLIGAHSSQYKLTPSVMRFLRSPEPTQDKPNHPIWIAFRDSAEGRTSSDECDLKYSC